MVDVRTVAVLGGRKLFAHFLRASVQSVAGRLSAVRQLHVHVSVELHGYFYHADQHRSVDAFSADQPAAGTVELCGRLVGSSARIVSAAGHLVGDTPALCAAVRAAGDGGREPGTDHCAVVCE